jgi:hypothetical protein
VVPNDGEDSANNEEEAGARHAASVIGEVAQVGEGAGESDKKCELKPEDGEQ